MLETCYKGQNNATSNSALTPWNHSFLYDKLLQQPMSDFLPPG